VKFVVTIVELSPGMHKAYCPALPGCMVIGSSPQEAAERISRAVAGYLASFDATAPEKLDLEMCEQGQSPRGAVSDASQAGLASRPKTPRTRWRPGL
jgi:predicted RNase H-like HicB family nuclease